MTILAALVRGTAALADPREIVDVTLERTGMSWRVDVTRRHPDTGWDHYAERRDVRDADGRRLGMRELHHPHVNAPPFIRALIHRDLPDGTRDIFIHARCSVDGWTEDGVRMAVTP